MKQRHKDAFVLVTRAVYSCLGGGKVIILEAVTEDVTEKKKLGMMSLCMELK
jgi:hypothetical protein